MSNSSERRTEARVPISLRVEYRRLNSFFADYAKNISRGGTFIETLNPLPIGTEFLFVLAVPTLAEPITLHGKVQWTVAENNGTEEKPAGMGIGFIYSSESERMEIATLVEDLMTQSLGDRLTKMLVR